MTARLQYLNDLTVATLRLRLAMICNDQTPGPALWETF